MRRKIRSISPEFKQDAACLLLDEGYSMADAGRAVDVHENTLRKWVQQLESERNGNTPKSNALTPEQ